MGSEECNLHIFFFPFLAHGHMIPTVDMAKLFASRGAKATIITTPINEPFIFKTIEKAKTHGKGSIHIKTVEFRPVDFGLPEGCDNVDFIRSSDKIPLFFEATRFLQEPFERLLIQHNPDCVVSDMFYPWTTDSAAKFGIPRIMFHGTNFFFMCVSESTRLYEPHKNVSSDSEYFVIPNLPDEIKMTRMQMPPFALHNEGKGTHPIAKLSKEAIESEKKSYGTVVNSFYELEKDYADHFRNVLGRKAWHIGPLFLINKDDTQDKAQRRKDASIDENECLKWLDTKKPNSIVYVCFGSIANFPDSQLRDIAIGLEASGQHFIWVVKKSKEDGDEWLPEGFEKRMEGKGLIIRGWAPQVLILEHQAIGAFVTHCGWNSTLEAVTAGVPMVTWPIAAEQFYNEKLVTEILKIGVPVGAKKWLRLIGDTVKWEAVEKGVKKIMVGEEAEEMRNKAKVLSQLAKSAVEKGGSSYSDLDALIVELASHKH
ncbi:scopoletin glucosyltransferase [Arachis duranensis]|uniref:Glycosyltransferase n=1 Tax=Arachis duranensis TaxID=130453 RepID=A0A6P4CG55_ARADU|nr:scopoletin glucosyltransferase [Arachis duranensis]XP_057743332.1 scopoletin glucosyltransferase-like [Arachis stenosperma]